MVKSIEAALVAFGIILLIAGSIDLLRRMYDVTLPWTVRALIFVIVGIALLMVYRGVKIIIQAFRL